MMGISVLLVALWLLFVLLVPKRGLGGIAERVHHTLEGDRTYLFGPPARFHGGFLAAFAGEALRLIDAGLGLYLLGLWAEAQGRRRREAAETDERPPSQPAAKAHAPVMRQYVMPPMAWRREWEASLLRQATEDPPAPPAVDVATGRVTPAGALLKIRTLGAFQLLSDGEDLAPALLRHPVLSFIWLYLLSYRAVNPAAPIHRQLLADEVSPGIDPEQQRDRLRKRLNDLQGDLPRALAERIKLEWDMVRFDLKGTEFDVASIQKTAEEWGASTGLLPKEGVATIEAAVAASSGEYLPFWDELDYHVTRGRGAGGELIRSIRQSVGDTCTRLLVRLAEHYRARRDSARFIPLLEEVLRREPEREDLATLLAAAYRETGQTSRLRQLEIRYPAGVGSKRGQREK
jgi:hypothetical protein